MIVLKHHQASGLGFFGFNVMFRAPLFTLPSSIANFQVSGILGRGTNFACGRGEGVKF